MMSHSLDTNNNADSLIYLAGSSAHHSASLSHDDTRHTGVLMCFRQMVCENISLAGHCHGCQFSRQLEKRYRVQCVRYAGQKLPANRSLCHTPRSTPHSLSTNSFGSSILAAPKLPKGGTWRFLLVF